MPELLKILNYMLILRYLHINSIYQSLFYIFVKFKMATVNIYDVYLIILSLFNGGITLIVVSCNHQNMN